MRPREEEAEKKLGTCSGLMCLAAARGVLQCLGGKTSTLVNCAKHVLIIVSLARIYKHPALVAANNSLGLPSKEQLQKRQTPIASPKASWQSHRDLLCFEAKCVFPSGLQCRQTVGNSCQCCLPECIIFISF